MKAVTNINTISSEMAAATTQTTSALAISREVISEPNTAFVVTIESVESRESRTFQKIEFAQLMLHIAKHINKPLGLVIDEALTGLIASRDFLGIQLNHAWGNLPEHEFDAISDEYLSRKEQDISLRDLERKIDILLSNTTISLDAEVLSEMFSCPLELAQKALRNVLAHWKQQDSLSE